jgi:hypothetical protein
MTKMILKQENQIFEVDVPDYLYDLVFHMINSQLMVPNNLQSNICYVCAINYRDFGDFKTWILKNICQKCDKQIPYIIQSPTSILDFKNCQMSWYLQNCMGKVAPMNVYMLEGIVAHSVDAFFSNLLCDKQFQTEVARVYPNRLLMLDKLKNYVQVHYDRLVKKVMEEILEKESSSAITELFLIQMKEDLFNSIIADQIELWGMRLYNAIKYQSNYPEQLAKTHLEYKVYGHYEKDGVRMLLTGRIDKLYPIGKRIYFIRDDKTSRYVYRSSLEDAAIQLGGYAYMLSQMYDYDVQVVGTIWLSRFVDIVPVEADEKGFLEWSRRLCDFIASQKIPTKCFPENKDCGFYTVCYPERKS